jgi:hypothetical protein
LDAVGLLDLGGVFAVRVRGGKGRVKSQVFNTKVFFPLVLSPPFPLKTHRFLKVYCVSISYALYSSRVSNVVPSVAVNFIL